ncbi:MAG TPA: efflux RND transporter periplasmic adaptor subunit [Phycisphaerae bacterium]|nr:efflux RND transporter periplasmic adaptor subunit [Phycisphaerae bacterium]HRW55384.1 efflux RND transporter periplasmic adaptor subunit [Phycisphaerae bacterium]
MNTKRILIGAGLIVVIALVVWQSNQPSAVVETTDVREGAIQAYVEERGITRLPHTYLISTPIAGWLNRIELREGDKVTAGQVVAKLELSDLEDRVKQAEHRIAVLQTQYEKESDHRLEDNMLVEMNATVKAIDETVRAAEAKIEASKAVAEFAQSEADRLGTLREKDAASAREYRQAETEARRTAAEYRGDLLELAALKTVAAVSYIGPKFVIDYKDRKSFEQHRIQRELDEARLELDLVKRNLERAVMESPIDGVVLSRQQTRHQYLQAGTPLLTLGRLEEMEVVADVLTERAMRLIVGNIVEITGEGLRDGGISGRVTRIFPEGFQKVSSLGVEQQRVPIVIAFDSRPESLGAEYRVDVRIIHESVDRAVIAPRSALFRDAEGVWRAFVLDGDVVRNQALTLGIMNDHDAEVRKGLAKGDRIVVAPSRDLKDGVHVKVE